MHRHPQLPSRYGRHHTSLCRIPSYSKSCCRARRIHIFCSRPLFSKLEVSFCVSFPCASTSFLLQMLISQNEGVHHSCSFVRWILCSYAYTFYVLFHVIP